MNIVDNNKKKLYDNKGIFFRVNEDKRKLMEEKMKLAGITNMRAYLTKMAIDGHIIQVDMTDIRRLTSLMGIASNNLNQIAHRVNETGNIYLEDITDLQQHYKGLWLSVNDILDKFAKIM